MSLPASCPDMFLVFYSYSLLSGAAQLPALDTMVGRLQECDALSQVSGSVSVLPYIHHQTIKITIQPSITVSPALPRALLSEAE